MTDPKDQQALADLEKQARRLEQNSRFLEAQEIYEQIDQKGWANAEHLLALGNCQLKNRQRRDARDAWLKAMTLDPEHEGCRSQLNRYFPGWERRLKRKDASDTDSGASPSAAPSRSGLSMSVEPPAPPRPAPSRPAPQAKPAPRPEPAPAKPTPEPAPVAPEPAPAFSGERRVNWEFVMGDAMNEAQAAKH